MSESIPQDSVDVVPHAMEDEACSIGCLIQEPREALDRFEEHLPDGSSALFDVRHRAIYDEIQAAMASGDGSDVVSLTRRLRERGKLNEAGGTTYLQSLTEMATTVGLLQVHLQAIREKHIARKAIGIAQNLMEAVHGPCEIEETVEQAISSLHECRTSISSSFTGKDCALAMTEDLEARHALQGKLTGIASGFPLFDRMISGLQSGEQVIIGARPNAGKSAIAINICHRACVLNSVPTLFISLEMPLKSVMRRMAADHCNLAAFDLRDGKITENDFKLLTAFSGTISRRPWFFKDGISGMTSAQVASCIREHIRKHGVKLVVIDYLQKIDPDKSHEKRTYEVGSVSKRLVSVARETGVALVTLAQLNRDSVKEKPRMPRISDLADSGQIERDGDIICLLHRETNVSSEAKFLLAKTRDGPGGIIDLHFDGSRCRFTESSNQSEEQQKPNEINE